MTRPPGLARSIDEEHGRLIAQRCSACNACYFPLSDLCPACGSNVEPAPLSGAGTVYSWTIVRRAPAGLSAPYVFAWIDMEEGPRLFGQIEASPSEMRVGMTVLAHIGPAPAGAPGDAYYFTPAADQPQSHRS